MRASCTFLRFSCFSRSSPCLPSSSSQPASWNLTVSRSFTRTQLFPLYFLFHLHFLSLSLCLGPLFFSSILCGLGNLCLVYSGVDAVSRRFQIIHVDENAAAEGRRDTKIPPCNGERRAMRTRILAQSCRRWNTAAAWEEQDARRRVRNIPPRARCIALARPARVFRVVWDNDIAAEAKRRFVSRFSMASVLVASVTPCCTYIHIRLYLYYLLATLSASGSPPLTRYNLNYSSTLRSRNSCLFCFNERQNCCKLCTVNTNNHNFFHSLLIINWRNKNNSFFFYFLIF